MSVGEWIKKLGNGAKRNAPAILTGLGIASMLGGTVLAVKATPEAQRRIEEKKEAENHEHLTLVQTVQATWRCYIWAAMAEATGAGCLIAACCEGSRREAALMTACNAAENGLREFREYRRYVAEQVGQAKEAEINNQAIQTMVDRNPPPASMASRELIDGVAPKPACYDATFGRYFYVDYDTVAEAVNRLNHEINTGINGYVSLNDFYDAIGVSTVEYGNRLGWSTETGLIAIPEKGQLRYVGTPNGWPCWVLEFDNPPQYEYQFFRKH